MDIMDAYFAGLFDGEGCVTIRKDKRVSKRGGSLSYQLICIVGMTHKPTVDRMQEIYGGSVVPRINPNGHKNAYQWTISSNQALDFLYRIAPYSLTKSDEIDLAIKFQENIRAYRKAFGHGKSHPERDAVLEMREQMFHKIKDLKKISF